MSEKLCTLRTKGGGGGKYTETVLWTNPSPTSVMAPTTLTLSDSISNYKYLRFNYNIAVDDATNNSIIIAVSDFKKCVSGNDKPICGLSGSSGYPSTRRFDYVSDTSISVNYSVRWGQSGNSSGSCIPLEILGLNELDHGKRFDETVLWTNNAPTSSFAAQVVTLSETIDNYDFIKLEYRRTTSDATICKVLTDVSSWRNLYNWIDSSGNANNRMTVQIMVSNSTYVRSTTCKDATSVSFGSCSNNSYLIPNRVVGCKFR